MAPDTSKRHEFASFSYLFMLLDSGTWGFVQSFTLRSTLPVESSPIGLPENPEFKLVHVRAKKTIPRPSSKTSPRQAPGLGPGACQSIAFHWRIMQSMALSYLGHSGNAFRACKALSHHFFAGKRMRKRMQVVLQRWKSWP